MVKTISVQQLLHTVDAVGLTVTPVSEAQANLYAWATPGQKVLYIGKAASARRLKQEKRWAQKDHTSDIYSGIITLIRENNAAPHPLRFEPSSGFNKKKAIKAAESVNFHDSPQIQTLIEWLEDQDNNLEPWGVEKVLIRTAVRSGVPIGNSQYASQWENPIGEISDSLALVAVSCVGISKPAPLGNTGADLDDH